MKENANNMPDSLLTTRFVALCPAAKAPLDPSSPTVRAINYQARTVGLCCLTQQSYGFWMLPSPSGTAGSAIPPVTVLDVFPGTARALGDAALDLRGDDRHRRIFARTSFYNLIDLHEDRLSIESDHLGHKPVFYAKIDDGTIIATHLADLFAVAPGAVTPLDRKGVLDLLGFGFVQGRRTLHQQVRRLATGEGLLWRRDAGLTIGNGRRISVPPMDVTSSLDDVLERIMSALRASLATQAESRQEPLLVGLSGGFDSRLLAGVACDLGLPLKAYSYGNRNHREIEIARLVGKKLAIPHRILPYRLNNFFEKLDYLVDRLEGHCDPQVTHILHLFDSGEPEGTSLIHGYMGGPLSGHHIGTFRSVELQTRDAAAAAIASHFGSRELKRGAAALGIELTSDEIVTNVRDELTNEGLPHQAITVWELENTQRSFIGGNLRLLGERFDLITPFYDPDVIGLWMSVPPLGYAHRYVFRQLLAKFHPKLAVLPHSEEYFPITPSLRWQTYFHVKEKLRRLQRSRMRRDGVPSAKDPYIWTLSHGGATEDQRRRLASLLEQHWPSAERLFGLPALNDAGAHLPRGAAISRRSLRQKLDMARRLLLLAKYAHWLEKTVGSAQTR